MAEFTPDFLGYSFIWYIGVVEDRIDPLRMGRVRVRPYGWYSDDKAKVPVDSLPWAQVIQDPTSAAMGDIGSSPTGLVEGSWVVGFFLDGERKQRPIVLGSLAGIPQTLGSEIDFTRKGFSDPNGVYPARKDEPDVNRLTRNDINFDHEVLDAKESGLTNAVPTADGSTWNELAIQYGAEYPFNHVRQTESGHIVEFDDTPDNERIHEYHKSGTFYEIDATGNKVTRIVGDNYEVIAGTDYVNVKGSANLTVDETLNIKAKTINIVADTITETYGTQTVTASTGNVTYTSGEITVADVTQTQHTHNNNDGPLTGPGDTLKPNVGT